MIFDQRKNFETNKQKSFIFDISKDNKRRRKVSIMCHFF